MKKLFALLLVLTGLTFSDLNAQTCCTTQTNCNAQQCCPSQTSCCEDGKGFLAFFQQWFSKKSPVASREQAPSKNAPSDLNAVEVSATQTVEQ